MTGFGSCIVSVAGMETSPVERVRLWPGNHSPHGDHLGKGFTHMQIGPSPGLCSRAVGTNAAGISFQVAAEKRKKKHHQCSALKTYTKKPNQATTRKIHNDCPVQFD